MDRCKESGCNNILKGTDALTGSGACFACEWASMSASEVKASAGPIARSHVWDNTKVKPKQFVRGRL